MRLGLDVDAIGWPIHAERLQFAAQGMALVLVVQRLLPGDDQVIRQTGNLGVLGHALDAEITHGLASVAWTRRQVTENEPSGFQPQDASWCAVRNEKSGR